MTTGMLWPNSSEHTRSEVSGLLVHEIERNGPKYRECLNSEHPGIILRRTEA
jgi:hypothetical protein